VWPEVDVVRKGLALALLLLSVACAGRTPAMPPAPTQPRYPDFIFPAASGELASASLADRLERGWRYLQADNLRSAEREFTEALKDAPAAAPAETALGYVELARKDTKDAIDRFDRALEGGGRYVPALVGRGQALLALGREGDALTSFETALGVEPVTGLRERVDVLRFRAVQDNLQRAKAASDAGRWDEARAAYQQAVTASPESAFLYRDLAGVERRAGQTPLALEHVRKAIALDANDAQAQVLLSELLEEQSDFAGALAALEAAHSIDSSAVSDALLARVRDRATLARLPAEFRAIETASSINRGDLAALLGVRLEGVLAAVRPRQVVITDIRGHWAQAWIMAVARAGVMEPLPNYTFQPASALSRADFAQVVNRALLLVGARRPELASKWQGVRLQISDVPPGHLAYPAVSAAVASGILSLDPNGAFNLLRPVTGAEANAAVTRLEALLGLASP
jgi:tetratricopeptide (TPR) repeat protein